MKPYFQGVTVQDASGALIPGGSGSQRYKYDAANRMVQVLADNGTTVLASYSYGDSRERLIADENGFGSFWWLILSH